MKEKLGYGVGAIGKDMCYAVVGSFFMIYCTDTLRVSPLFMGLLFFFARIWDAFNDPIMGTIVDNTRNKFGKYRTWILAGTLLNVVVLVLLFFKPSFVTEGTVSAMSYVAVMYVAWGMTYTLVDVPYWAFSSAITDNPEERDVVSTIPRLFAGVGNFAVQIFTITVVGKLGGEEVANAGYLKWAMIIAAINVFFILITIFTIKERVIVKQDKKFSFRDALSTLKNNDQLMIIVLVLILTNLAMNLATSVAIYYFKYSWFSPNTYSTFSVCIGAGLAIGLVGYPLLAKKVKKRTLVAVSIIVPLFGFLVMMVLAMLTEGMNPDTRIIAVAVPGALFCTGFGSLTVLTTVMLIDTVDYGEWKLGYRSESIIFSMQTFLVKFATAIAGLVSGFALTFAGYDLKDAIAETAGGATDATEQTVEVVKEAATAALGDALPRVQNILNVMLFILPPVVLAISLVIFLKKYKLHGEYLENIQTELVDIRAEKNKVAD